MKNLQPIFIGLCAILLVSFVMGEPFLKPGQKTPQKIPYVDKNPQINSFKINGDATSTYRKRVYLIITAKNASSFRASEDQNFPGATWRSWSQGSHPKFTLSNGFGQKTIYLQMKNARGKLSSTASDSILYQAQRRQTYMIQAGVAHDFAASHGFTFSTTKCDPTSTCDMEITFGTIAMNSGRGSYVGPDDSFGSKCDFILFGKRNLNPNWTFKSYTTGENCKRGGRGYKITAPMVGGRSITFKVHIWNPSPLEPNTTDFCNLWLKTITIEGPAGVQWQDAFKE